MNSTRVKRFGSDANDGDHVIVRRGKTIDPSTGKERQPLQHAVPLRPKKVKSK